MDNEIISLIDSVKQRTGISVRVYLENGDDSYSPVAGEMIVRADGKVDGIKDVAEKGKTYFKFRHKADEYVGYVNSENGNGGSIAGVISVMLENIGGKEFSATKKESLKSVLLGECNALQA